MGGHQRSDHLPDNARVDAKPHKDDCGTVAIGTITVGNNVWPYREVDWDEDTEKAAMIAANASGGEFDVDKLSAMVRDFNSKAFDMEALGLKDVESLLEMPDAGQEGADDAPKAPTKTGVKRGDVYVLGAHRLMCGDATKREDVERLMGRDRAALVAIDPPYGVSYKAENFDVIKGDRKRDDALYQLVRDALLQAAAFSEDTAAFYVWHASATRREFEDALRDAGLTERQYIVWAKPSFVMGRADYHWGHEPCFYAAKTGHGPKWHGDRAQSTVWRATLRQKAAISTTLGTGLVLTDGKGGQVAVLPGLAKGKKVRSLRLEPGFPALIDASSEGASDVWEVGREHGQDYVHPTQKPVELFTIPLKNSSKPGEIVLDLFGGSGSALMAAEATGRAARILELDPLYVHAIVQRWEEATSQVAVKE